VRVNVLTRFAGLHDGYEKMMKTAERNSGNPVTSGNQFKTIG